jgi:hypothetical protein
MLFNPYLHFLVARVVDPVGKMISDLNYLNFRRNVMLAISRKDGRFALCVHDECAPKFKRLEIFNVLGNDLDLILVRGKKETRKHDAHGMMCCCADQTKLVKKENLVHRADLPGGAGVLAIDDSLVGLNEKTPSPSCTLAG